MSSSIKTVIHPHIRPRPAPVPSSVASIVAIHELLAFATETTTSSLPKSANRQSDGDKSNQKRDPYHVQQVRKFHSFISLRIIARTPKPYRVRRRLFQAVLLLYDTHNLQAERLQFYFNPIAEADDGFQENMTTGSRNMRLGERFATVHDRIDRAARRSGRRPDEIRLIAITKTHPATVIREALAIGARDFGENRVQEAEQKILEVGRTSACWHLVGHLQANKARRAVKLFDVIHSLDSVELAERLNRLCIEEKRDEVLVLIQVDLAQEVTKSGAEEGEIPQLVEKLNGLSHVRLIGLMTLPPFFEDAEKIRPFFRKLRALRDELARSGAFGDNPGDLSMGMTHDFEIAIEEGATMVRVGTALFGTRA